MLLKIPLFWIFLILNAINKIEKLAEEKIGLNDLVKEACSEGKSKGYNM